MNRTGYRPVLAIATIVLACATFGCSRQPPAGDGADLYRADPAKLTPGTQIVRIGEGGPSFPACSATGTVVNLSPAGDAYLPLRAAPFAEADETARLGDGARLFLCTRSLDQRWQGVVVPPADAQAADCGVTASLAGPRPYAGPCRSGWVLTSFVRPAAG